MASNREGRHTAPLTQSYDLDLPCRTANQQALDSQQGMPAGCGLVQPDDAAVPPVIPILLRRLERPSMLPRRLQVQVQEQRGGKVFETRPFMDQ